MSLYFDNSILNVDSTSFVNNEPVYRISALSLDYSYFDSEQTFY